MSAAWLLEDPDGAPYPDAVQRLVELFQINPGTAGQDALIAALESVRGAADDGDTTLEEAQAYLRSVGIDPERVRKP